MQHFLQTTGIFLLLTFLLFACKSKQGLVSEKHQPEPHPHSFRYFKAGANYSSNPSALRLDGLYFRVVEADPFGDLCKMFRFYPDGLVISYIVYSSPNEVMELPKQAAGNIHGYFQATGDSIALSTKVFYNHEPILYSGKCWGDSILLNQFMPNTDSAFSQVYYFYNGEGLSGG